MFRYLIQIVYQEEPEELSKIACFIRNIVN